jgi:signal transduction histidine kinase
MDAPDAHEDLVTAFRHDVRTPLHTILGFAQMLRDEALSDDAKRYLDHIEHAGLQLARLIDEFPAGSAVQSSDGDGFSV